MPKDKKNEVNQPKLFVLENDKNHQKQLEQILVDFEAQFRICSDAKKIYRDLKSEVPDLLIMSCNIPDEDATTFCRDFRRLYPWVPVIALTEGKDVAQRVALLDSGADDCIIKPYDRTEFLARIRRSLKRFNELFDYYQMERTSCELDSIGLVMNPDKWEARFKNVIMDLSKTEFKLMELFCQHPNETLPRSVLVQKVWRAKPPSSPRTIDNFVMRLRKKLNQAIEETSTSNSSVQLITVHGLGYHLKVKQLKSQRKYASNAQ